MQTSPKNSGTPSESSCASRPTSQSDSMSSPSAGASLAPVLSDDSSKSTTATTESLPTLTDKKRSRHLRRIAELVAGLAHDPDRHRQAWVTLGRIEAVLEHAGYLERRPTHDPTKKGA